MYQVRVCCVCARVGACAVSAARDEHTRRGADESRPASSPVCRRARPRRARGGMLWRHGWRGARARAGVRSLELSLECARNTSVRDFWVTAREALSSEAVFSRAARPRACVCDAMHELSPPTHPPTPLAQWHWHCQWFSFFFLFVCVIMAPTQHIWVPRSFPTGRNEEGIRSHLLHDGVCPPEKHL